VCPVCDGAVRRRCAAENPFARSGPTPRPPGKRDFGGETTIRVLANELFASGGAILAPGGVIRKGGNAIRDLGGAIRRRRITIRHCRIASPSHGIYDPLLPDRDPAVAERVSLAQ
jgi:hypothetical protein